MRIEGAAIEAIEQAAKEFQRHAPKLIAEQRRGEAPDFQHAAKAFCARNSDLPEPLVRTFSAFESPFCFSILDLGC